QVEARHHEQRQREQRENADPDGDLLRSDGDEVEDDVDQDQQRENDGQSAVELPNSRVPAHGSSRANRLPPRSSWVIRHTVNSMGSNHSAARAVNIPRPIGPSGGRAHESPAGALRRRLALPSNSGSRLRTGYRGRPRTPPPEGKRVFEPYASPLGPPSLDPTQRISRERFPVPRDQGSELGP